MNDEIAQLLNDLSNQEEIIAHAMEKMEEELQVIRSKRGAVETTLGLLNQKSPPLALNGTHFEGLSLSEAVLACVKLFGKDGITRTEVMNRLKANGFQFGGEKRNYYSSVAITLRRLHLGKHEIDLLSKNGVALYAPKQSSQAEQG